MNQDDINNMDDELTEDELAGVTGGRRISPAAVSASKLQVGAKPTATGAKALSPSAVAAVKGLTRTTSSKDLTGTISPVKGTVGIDD